MSVEHICEYLFPSREQFKYTIIVFKSKDVFNICILLNGDIMLINYTDKELDLCARLMRSEALSEGELGMLMVGNVLVNRSLVNCLDFKNFRTISDVIYQKNQFSGVNSSLFYSSATSKEKELAKRVLRGEYYHPATNALYFYYPGNNSCKSSWYGQLFSGRYKNHCFYEPEAGVCKELH